MSDKKRSDIISTSPSPLMNMFRKGLLHGAGYSTDRISQRPLIAIANSHAALTTGHTHLGMLAQRVRGGITPPEAKRQNSMCRPPAMVWQWHTTACALCWHNAT